MYIKDMPLVALGCIDKSADRLNLDFVLDRVVDDRIEAAYAIVELGERGSRKRVEFPLPEEEELDVDEADHLVPRSPECLREFGRGTCNRSVDTSPVRDNQPKVVHVKGAVMPTRTAGHSVQKLPSKRRHETDANNCGIKAKLARMLIDKKTSQGEAGKSCSNDDGRCQRNGSGADSDEEQSTDTAGGKFVRTSMPIFQPINVASQIQSSANSRHNYLLERLELRTERSVSAEEISRLRSSLQKSINNEQFDRLLQGDDSQHKVLSRYGNTQNISTEVSHFKMSEASRNGRTYASDISPNDVHVVSSSQCSQNSVVHSKQLSVLDRDLDIENSRVEASSTPSQVARDGNCFLFRPAGHSTSTSGTEGLLQYYMLPVMKSLPNSIRNSIRPEMCGIQSVIGNDVDALKRLEQFSLGNGYCMEPVLKDNLVVPEMQQSPLARRYCQKFGSLNSISNYYGFSNSPVVSGTGHPISGSLESLSLQNLPGPSRDSPSLTHGSSHKLRPVKSEFPVIESRSPQSIGDLLKLETKTAKPIGKNTAILDALEMIKGGEFGSLRTIRNLYMQMGSRNAVDLPSNLLQDTQANQLMTKTSRSRGQDQELPLDLSKYHQRNSQWFTEPIVDLKPCFPEPQGFQMFPSVELCKNENCGSEVSLDEHVTHSDVLPLRTNGFAAVNSESTSASTEVTDSKNSRTDNSDVTGSSSHSVPNSHLPPKKRKLRLISQNCDMSESKTAPSAKSTSPPCQGLTNKSKSYAHQSSSNICSNQTSETLNGGKLSETEMKVLPDVTTAEESVLLSAVRVRDEDGDLPLHIAVAQGSVDIVNKLLPAMSQVGVSVDSCNNSRQTALLLAVISNQPQMVELLLNASASANVCDRKGNTAIHLAVKYKTLLCLETILSNSQIQLDLDARNYEGLTALHIGVQLSQTDAVKALLIGGADPNTADGTNGRTPLFNAVETDDYAIASTLLLYGSDPCIASYSGCTPLQIASAKSLRNMTSILERSGREWTERV